MSYDFFRKWNSDGSGTLAGRFGNITGVAVDSTTQEVYVADSQNHRIQKFRLAKHCRIGTTKVVPGVCFVKKWGNQGQSDGQFVHPWDVAVDSSTHQVYVLDAGNSRIQVFTSNGDYITKWGNHGSGNGEFYSPYGIGVDSSSHEVYVADTNNHRVQKFQLAKPCPSGTTQIAPGVCFVTRWGSYGQENGKFWFPEDVTIDSSTHEVYVADTQNSRIQKFDRMGNFTMTWNSWGEGDLYLHRPRGVGVDSSTHQVFAADTDMDRIVVFTNNGAYITKWGKHGSGNGEFYGPIGVDVDYSTHNAFVAEMGNFRVQAFTPH
jgi:DNA-binding beta-propeller fold protein YncE